MNAIDCIVNDSYCEKMLLFWFIATLNRAHALTQNWAESSTIFQRIQPTVIQNVFLF